jgi:hypothetical protein
VTVGAGVTASSGKPFAGAESGVEARMGGSSGADGSAAGLTAACDTAGGAGLGFLGAEPSLRGADDGVPTAEAPLPEEPTKNAGAPSGTLPFGPSAPQTAAATDEPGGGLAAPLIGAGAAASMAASGLSLGNKPRGGKADPEDETAAGTPIVAAKEASGIFSGHLKGEYVLLTSALSLLFSGASVASGVRANRKSRRPDDRFRIGDGVSAVLRGGATQERMR